MENYVRPELKRAETDRAKEEMLKLMRKSGPELRGLILLLIMENMVLTKEVNEHRAARGFKPLEVH